MDAIEAMLRRTSARSGVPSGPVDLARVHAILRCGEAAPSSKDARPWAFHVIDDRAQLERIAEAMARAAGIEQFVPLDPMTGRKRDTWESTVVESAITLRSAAIAIVVENRGKFSRSRRAIAGVADELREDALLGYSLELIGIGAAIQNLWLAATAEGLAASYMGDVLIVEKQVQRVVGAAGDLVGLLALRDSP